MRVVWTLKSHRVWLGLNIFIFLMGFVAVLSCIHFTTVTAVLVIIIVIFSLVQLRSAVRLCRPLALIWDGGALWWLEYKHRACCVNLVQVGWLSRWVVTLQCELPDGSLQWLMFMGGIHSLESMRRLQFQLHCRFR